MGVYDFDAAVAQESRASSRMINIWGIIVTSKDDSLDAALDNQVRAGLEYSITRSMQTWFKRCYNSASPGLVIAGIKRHALRMHKHCYSWHKRPISFANDIFFFVKNKGANIRAMNSCWCFLCQFYALRHIDFECLRSFHC